MRNLAGRLTARTNPELMRIAEFWQTVVYGRDKHAVVGQLYREMREVRSARDVWQRLEPEERDIISLMALDNQDERSWTLPALSASLGRDLEATREVAITLYRKGILYREGDDDELPVGELPRVFLPRELTSSFRRVQDEIDAGPLDRVPLPALLALLDETELEQAALLWGVEVHPSLQNRDEIARQLTMAIQDPDRRKTVISGLSTDARNLWSRLMDREGSIAPLEEILSEIGIEGEGVVVLQRQRDALGQLEERLLAWHSYGSQGARLLFMPESVRERRRLIERAAQSPQTVEEPVAPDPWRHPWAVPWDLLTLLREVSGRQASEVPISAAHLWSEQLEGKLWNAGNEDHLANYLTFLAALGRNENVLQNGENDETQILRPGRSWKQWRSRPFSDQFSHLIWWWMASPEWIEVTERSGVMVEHAALPQFRRKLLSLMSQLDLGIWFEIGSISQWIADIDPDILGEDAAVASSSALELPLGSPGWSRLATATVIRKELESAFAWFGLIDLGQTPDGAVQIRATELLQQLQSDRPLVEESQPAGRSMEITENAVIELRAPSPVRVWALSAFAELVELRPIPRYQISEESLNKALAEGPTLRDVIGYLELETSEPLPPEFAERLRDWASKDCRVRVGLTAELVTDTEAHDTALRTILQEAGWELNSQESPIHVYLSDSGKLEELLGLIERAGYLPNVRGPSEQSPQRDDSPDGP